MQNLDLPVKSFKTIKDWEKWLEKNHKNPNGIWLKFYKKNSGIKSIYYAEALDVALCYGWIDAQLKSLDERAYLQRFTPRRKGSIWSKRNTEHIARLTKEGRMKPAGLAAVAEAKKNGKWESAYHSSNKAVMPADFLKILDRNKKAKQHYETLNRANKYAIFFQLTTAKKPETREKRMKKILLMLNNQEKFHW